MEKSVFYLFFNGKNQQNHSCILLGLNEKVVNIEQNHLLFLILAHLRRIVHVSTCEGM